MPRARHNNDQDLRDTIPHRPRVRRLTQVPVICLSLSLILLLPPDVFELLVEVAHFRGHFGDVGAVLLDVCLGGADDDVEVHAYVGVGEPRGVVGGEADGVVASDVGGECKAPVVWASCAYDGVRAVGFLCKGT